MSSIRNNLLPLQLILVAVFTISLIDAEPTDVRKLQSTAMFRANYTADFQYLCDSFCLGDAPVLQITCFGDLTILGTSDPSIQCSEWIPDFVNRTTYQCNNTCTDCGSIYLASGDVSDGPFASIGFTCKGDSVQDVDAYVNFLGGNNGTCADTTGFGTTVTNNFHVARLGVSCPIESSRGYIYDDTYFECRSSGSFTLTSTFSDGDKYTCASGLNCGGSVCEVPFSDFYIYADVPAFLDSCVESTMPITDYPTDSPATSSFEFSVRFVASWGRLYEPIASASNCTSFNPAVVVSCENGASISFVNSSDGRMNCFRIGANELQCVGDESKIDNLLTSVFYDCVGPALPKARVTYPESTVYCNGNKESAIVRHVVSLDVVCTSSSENIMFHGDLYFECAELNDQVDVENMGDFGLKENRYICGQSAIFPAGSLSSNPITLSDAAVITDTYWLTNPNKGCFDLKRAPSSSSAPTRSPIPRPVTNAPISPLPTTGLPTESPTDASLPTQSPTEETKPTESPTKVNAPTQTPTEETTNTTTHPTRRPGVAPIDVPVGPGSAPPMAAVRGSSHTSAIAGETVAGVAIVALLALLILRKNGRWDNRNEKPPGSGVDVSASHSSTEENTVYQEYLKFLTPQAVVATRIAGPNSNLATEDANAHAPENTSHHACPWYSTAPVASGDFYELCYKDRSPTAIGLSQSSAPMAVSDVPMTEAIPITVVIDTSTESMKSTNSAACQSSYRYPTS